MSVPAIIAVAVAVFFGLSWLHWRRSGTYVAPGLGAVGGGTAMIAVGGVLVAKGHELPGLLLDLFGVVAIWAAFTTYSQE
jgi:hypothetical protein